MLGEGVQQNLNMKLIKTFTMVQKKTEKKAVAKSVANLLLSQVLAPIEIRPGGS